MDVWIGGDRFRVSIPALDRIVRGDRSTEPRAMRGLPIALLTRWLVSPFGGTPVAVHLGRVDSDGSVVEDASSGPAGTRSFVAFLLRSGTFEARARRVSSSGIQARAWWLDHGRLTAYLVGVERPLGEGESAAIVPVDATYVSYDPAMTVRVKGTSVAFVADTEPLPSATFVDPDGE